MVDITKYQGDVNFESSEATISCVFCGSKKAFNVLATCLHCICDECMPSVKKKEGYNCTLCTELSIKLYKNSLLAFNELSRSNPPCSWCVDNGDAKTSSGKCEECDIWLCNECISGHNRMPPFRLHNVKLNKIIPSENGLCCEQHPKETLELYCEKCEMLTCRDCQLSVHREHGGHKWVGEKAATLKPELQQAVDALTIENSGLSDALGRIKVELQPESRLRLKAQKAKETIKDYSSSLIKAIKEEFEKIISQVDENTNSSIEKLQIVLEEMEKLQKQVDHSLDFASHLISNSESDPASLVQLSSSLLTRSRSLSKRALLLSTDAPPFQDFRDNLQRKPETIGWKESIQTIPSFLTPFPANSMQAFSQHQAEIKRICGCLHWDHGKTNNPLLSLHHEESSVHMENSEDLIRKSENDAFLDRLAEIEGTDTNRKSCAVCFETGLLATCVKCNRRYHPDCHLPRLLYQECFPHYTNDWICSICNSKPSTEPYEPPSKRSKSKTRNNSSTGISKNEFITGCRILLDLCIRPQMAYFTTSRCPACGLPPVGPSKDSKLARMCPVDHIFHKIDLLRLELEYNCPEALNEELLKINGLNWEDLNYKLSSFNDWINHLKSFLNEASCDKNKIVGSTPGLVKAAVYLKNQIPHLLQKYSLRDILE